MSTLNKTKNAEVEVLCTIETEAWKAAQEKAFNKLAKKVEIPGFRKGQAPKSMVRQQLSEQAILLEAAESLAQKELEAAIVEHGIELIDRPNLDVETINEEECTLKFVCPVKPEVTLGQYKELGYKVTKPRITTKEVDGEVEKIQEAKADLEIKEEDGVVEDGNTVVIDFEGFKDGVAFEGGKGENYDLTIGSHTFIPGFEEQLIGMKSEETREIEVTFPEDYQAEELKGAKATFKVTVHEIKFKVLPEVNDEFVAELNIENVKTVEELKAYIKDVLSKNRLAENEAKAEGELLDKLMENCSVEVPEIMIETEMDEIVEDTAQRLYSQYAAQGINMELCQNIAASQREMMKEDATKRVTVRLILEAIAKAEKVEVTEEELNAELETIANTYGRTTEEVKSLLPLNSVKYDLTLRKALEVAKA